MFVENPLYISQIEYAYSLKIDWSRFESRTFFITGAAGLIGTFLVDLLMYASEKGDLNITIFAVGRNEKTAEKRFSRYYNIENFTFIKHDMNQPIHADINCDYIIHGASNTHPAAYSSDPIGTITTNIIGTQNVLEFAAKQENSRTAFLSSVEVYGENRGDVERFDESYCGYIDCNTLRAGYPESKRAGEALCQAYIHAKNLDIVIPRLSRVYGPTMSENDSKAIAQFIKKAVKKEDIVLKSEGNQLYSYTYVLDAATAILYILLYGKGGNAYNVSDEDSQISLKNLAGILADIADRNVTFELPDNVELQGYSKATKAVLDNTKLKKLGWTSEFDIKKGLEQTVSMLLSKEVDI